MQATPAAASSWVMWFRRCCCSRFPWSLALRVFPLLLHDGPWTFGGVCYRCSICGWALHWHWCPVLVCIAHPLSLTSLVKSESYTNLGVERYRFVGQFDLKSILPIFQNNSGRVHPGICELSSLGFLVRLTVLDLCFLLWSKPHRAKQKGVDYPCDIPVTIVTMGT